MSIDLTTDPQQQAIAAVLARMESAWAAADADAYGACFTADATYVTWVGTTYRGRAAIADSHRVLWEKFLKGTRLVSSDVVISRVCDDVAVVTSRGDTAKGAKAPRRLSKVQTTVLVRQDGEWLIAAFHNGKAHRLMEAMSFRSEPRLMPTP